MNIVLLFALQAAEPWVISPPAPTIGDTVVVERLVAVGGDARLRAQPLGSSLLVESLADPVVIRSDSGVLVRYVLALFEPGRHAVAMPAAEALYRDGRVEQVPSDTAWITVAAVLPAQDSLAPPQPSQPPLARFPTRPLPLVLFLGLVGALAVAWAVWRRRRHGVEPGPVAIPGSPAPLARWVSAGEGRAVTTVAAGRLRERIAALEPRAARTLSVEECIAVLEDTRSDWPLRAVVDTLRGLERARFAPAVGTDVDALVARVDDLMTGLEPAPAPVP
ncbi:MAG: hypothetical protein EXR93_09595 [Gemmatimonadetes bacterium]|nr:hypothetical protein [Gemmatimonadota bacterium]